MNSLTDFKISGLEDAFYIPSKIAHLSTFPSFFSFLDLFGEDFLIELDELRNTLPVDIISNNMVAERYWYEFYLKYTLFLSIIPLVQFQLLIFLKCQSFLWSSCNFDF